MDAVVVIPTRNRPASLRRCLDALARQRTPRSFEIVVVDDDDPPSLHLDDVPDGPGPAVRVIATGGVGPARARNTGWEATRASVVIFTDDDTAPCADWVESACRFLEDNPGHVGVEGPTVSPPFDALYERSIRNDRPGAYWTCNVAYRRDVLERVGGFCEAFPAPHAEDLDLGFRALRHGPIGYVEAMEVTHFPAPVTIPDMIRRARYSSASDIALYRRHPERFPMRVPAQLQPPLALLRYQKGTLRREGLGLIRTPRRFARFAVVVAGMLAMSVRTSFSASVADGDGRP